MKNKYYLLSILLISIFFSGCNKNLENRTFETKEDGTVSTPVITDPITTTTSAEDALLALSPVIIKEKEETTPAEAEIIIPNDIKPVTDGINYSEIEKLDNKKQGWGMGPARDKMNRPTDAVNFNEKYNKYNGIFIGNEADDEKNIYLTFDEGYENGYTSKILDILKEKGTKATFFITYDYCKSSPDLVSRMIDEGHEVGNHTYTHPSLPECSATEVADEIMKLHDYVKEIFGYEMRLIRFPMGEFSERTLEVASSLGYKTIFWSFAHVDWDVNNQPSVENAYKKITEATHPGAIYLLHAVSSANTESLSDVIDYWNNNDYKVCLF